MDIQGLSHQYTVRRLTPADAKAVLALAAQNEIFYRYHPPLPTVQSITEDMTALPDEVTGAMAEGAEIAALMAPSHIEADENGRTSNPRVWAGGDIVTGAATVILAMGAGKKAAASIAETLLAE